MRLAGRGRPEDVFVMGWCMVTVGGWIQTAVAMGEGERERTGRTYSNEVLGQHSPIFEREGKRK